MTTPQNILDFWFKEIRPELWFKKDDLFDQEIRSRFSDVYEKVLRGETKSWRATPSGRLAEILVLDQFARNMFRGTAKAFAGDTLALQLAQEAVHAKDDLQLPIVQRAFLYMPYMHSENPKIHDIAVQLFSQPGLEENLKFERLHKVIIDRFGRYPHRNAVLGRTSTPEEIEFLKGANSSF